MTANKYPPNPILLVDDETTFLESCRITLRTAGINNVILCQDSRNVLSVLKENYIDIILLDLDMPHVSGKELLQEAVEEFPDTPVIILTGANEIETAIECMKIGAFDYMVKPVEESRLISGIKRAIEIRDLQQENLALKKHLLTDKLEHPEVFSGIVTENKIMRFIFKYIESIAKTSRPVLITGETGVGKELIAKALHALSGFKGSFVPVNAGGLEDTVFSDTLFGHKKGAFTGADQPRAGLIEQASGGTLFLDEIGHLEQVSQVKLLRLLQEREYYSLGVDLPKISDARIMASTNCDIQALQKEGKFRTDLYYRLSTHHVNIPPLRDRIGDLHLLIEHFLHEASKALGKKKPACPKELITLLSTYHFPGNVRELQGLIFDAVSIHKQGTLSMSIFREYIGKERKSGRNIGEKDADSGTKFTPFTILQNGIFPTLKATEQLLIEEAMKRADHNQTTAAEMLGLTRSALNKRLNRRK